MKKYIHLFLFALFVQGMTAQIKITEVFADTPYNEGQTGINHYLGEYIELYNYSSEAITLNGWALSDKVTVFYFPDNITIPSGEFIVVAYRQTLDAGNYFTNFFPSTEGKESQIIYQDQMIMRNPHESVYLHMGLLHDIDFGGYTISRAGWGNGSLSTNEDPNYLESPQSVDFYRDSYHFGSSGVPLKSIATPLDESDVPPIQEIEDILSFKQAVLNQLSYMTWEEAARKILEITCTVTISEVSQAPFGQFDQGVVCFSYDQSGNYHTVDCSDEDDDGNTQDENGYSSSQLEDIASKIVIYPNPTPDQVSLAWDPSIDGMVTEVMIASPTGAILYQLSVAYGTTTATYSLGSSVSGFYIANFTLDTGQSISKIIIKQ